MAVTRVFSFHDTAGFSSAARYWPGVDTPLQAGDVLVLLDAGNYTSTSDHLTVIASPSTTWRKVGSNSQHSWWVGDVSAPVAAGWDLTLAGSTLPPGAARSKFLTQLRGLTSSAAAFVTGGGTTGTHTSPPVGAGAGQAVFTAGYSDTAADAGTVRAPSTDWHSQATQFVTSRHAAVGVRVPSAASEVHTVTASRSSGSAFVSAIVVGDAGEPVEPEPPATLGLSAFVDGAWAELPVMARKGGTWARARVRRYGDPGWPLSAADAIDAATTVAGVQEAVGQVAAGYAVNAQIRQTGPVGIGSYAAASSPDDGYLRVAAKALVAALQQYPTTLLKNTAGASDGWSFYLGRTLMLSGSEVSGFYSSKGLYLNSDITDYGLQMLGDRFHTAVFVIHHELAHGFWEQKTGAALTTFKNEMAAANPPGFTYLGAAGRDAAYEGDHPLGFPRAYGRTDANEDQADIIGWLLTPHLWERDGARWFGTDPYLAAKAAAARKWLTSLGFTGL